ncbi:hypothetical protein MASR1M74_13190 [Lentimicrobium sp.]
MKSEYKSLPWLFLLILGLYWIGLSIFLLVLGYRDSFLLINGWHHYILDWPMFLGTHLGDALILTSLIALLFGKKQPAMILNMIIAVVILGLFGQLLKNTLFDGWDRPFRVFENIADVHSVAGYRMIHNAFPSGHSIVVSAVISTFVLTARPGLLLQGVLAMAVVMISYTRVYVGVHFPGDVLAGTLIGFIGSWLLSLSVYPKVVNWVNGLKPGTIRRLKTNLMIIAAVGLILGVVFVVLSLNRV